MLIIYGLSLHLWQKGEDKTKATTLQGETGQGEGKGEDAPISGEQDLNNANIEGWTRRERYYGF